MGWQSEDLGGTGNCDNSGSHLRPTVEALALKC